MPASKDNSGIEATFRDIILAELKEITTGQKETKRSVDELINRLKTLEILVVGVEGAPPAPCIASRITALENGMEELRAFKIRVVTTIIVLQAIGAIIVGAIFQWYR